MGRRTSEVPVTQMKEWISVRHAPAGTYVTVSLQEGNLASKWTCKGYPSALKKAIVEARTNALACMNELRDVAQEQVAA